MLPVRERLAGSRADRLGIEAQASAQNALIRLSAMQYYMYVISSRPANANDFARHPAASRSKASCLESWLERPLGLIGSVYVR